MLATTLNLLVEFWGEVKQIWQQGIYGYDMTNLIIALIIFYLFYVLRSLLTRFVLNMLRFWAARTAMKYDDKIVDTLYGPVRLIPIALGIFIASRVAVPPAEMQSFFDNLCRSLIVVILFWTLHNVVDVVSTEISKFRRILSKDLVHWLVGGIRVLFIVIASSIILELWGIKVGPIIAGLGLFGVAVALGAQDLFKNLISGILVIAEKRFHSGDWILVDGIVEGTVDKIGFRSTKVIRFDKAPVFVPNTNFADKAVTNFSRMSHRRIYWKVGLEYRTGKKQLMQIRDKVEAFIVNHDAFEKPENIATFVRIDSFNTHSIDLMIYCFTKSIVWGEWLVAKEELALALQEIVKEAGANFALPSRSVYIEPSMMMDTPEIFTPYSDMASGKKQVKTAAKKASTPKTGVKRAPKAALKPKE